MSALTYANDALGRRVGSTLSLLTNKSSRQMVNSSAFLYDGWNLVAKVLVTSRLPLLLPRAAVQ